VHYMTAYRYVRLGLLPAVKSGGTWRVAQSDLDEFHTAGNAAPVEKGAEKSGRRRAPWADRLESRLLAGDARGAWSVVEAALAAGAELEEIYLDVLAPAMGMIGSRWERGELDISIEHRATGIAMRLVGRLGPRFVRRGRTRGVVVLGAPAGERHALPIAMLADLVRQHGWDVSDLGADVPDASFVHAVLTTPDVVAVGLSVTTTDSLEAAASSLAGLREATSGILLVVGGRAIVDEEHGRSLGADAVARSSKEFAALLDGLKSHDDAPSRAVGG
jgi:MerR family transcriptional regulator, light-induced transcriptional regulator